MAPDASYLSLKLAHALFSKSPEALDSAERNRVAAVAARQQQIESRILATPNAALVVLPPASVDACLKDIRDRYSAEPEFEADLAQAGLNAESLRAAVERDLVVEAVLEQVALGAAPVTDTEVEIFYLQHNPRFRRPETRTLRHILVTVNDSLPGNERAAASAKIDAIRQRLVKEPKRFSEQALKHSECPTAMNGGLLGKVPRGKLFAEVEAAAFALEPGALSGVVESPVGFHVLLCDSIHDETQLPLAEVRDKIRAHMTEMRQRAFQKSWIAGLRGKSSRSESETLSGNP
jgi:peptidylprolyl isomerase/peptidyl-prolyl cis-trans isomerase C